MIDALPILGVCGWSGSGKTTLLERIVPTLVEKGLSVIVVKHDAHGIDVGRPGKDSDRLYRAGADVLLQGPEQGFLRMHPAWASDLTTTLTQLSTQYDLVLVEGHKSTPLRKFWLLAEDETAPPPGVQKIVAVLSRDSDRPATVLGMLERLLTEQWLATPICGRVLTGDRGAAALACPPEQSGRLCGTRTYGKLPSEASSAIRGA